MPINIGTNRHRDQPPLDNGQTATYVRSMSRLSQEHAETLALRALAHIAADEHAMGGLVAQTGLAPDDLRGGILDPELLAGILDFLLSDDGLAADFCAAQNIPPTHLGAARRALPGGETYEY